MSDFVIKYQANYVVKPRQNNSCNFVTIRTLNIFLGECVDATFTRPHDERLYYKDDVICCFIGKLVYCNIRMKNVKPSLKFPILLFD